MTWWFGYVAGGKTTKAEGNGQRIPREFFVDREIRALGLECWLPREIKFIRKGKQRRPEPIEQPFLPNYIFLDLPAERFTEALGVKYLQPTLKALTRADVKQLGIFRAAVDERYRQAQRAVNNRDAICEYKKGEPLMVLDGPFADTLLEFVRMVDRASDPHPKIVAETEIFGRKAELEFDPLDVRAAE